MWYLIVATCSFIGGHFLWKDTTVKNIETVVTRVETKVDTVLLEQAKQMIVINRIEERQNDYYEGIQQMFTDLDSAVMDAIDEHEQRMIHYMSTTLLDSIDGRIRSAQNRMRHN